MRKVGWNKSWDRSSVATINSDIFSMAVLIQTTCFLVCFSLEVRDVIFIGTHPPKCLAMPQIPPHSHPCLVIRCLFLSHSAPVTCYFAVTSVRGLDHSRTCLLQDTSYITLLWCNEFCTYITGQGSVILTVVLHQVSKFYIMLF